MELAWGLAAAAAVGLGVTVRAYRNASRLQVTRHDVALAGLDPAWEGLTVAQLSDVHGVSSPGGRPLSAWVAACAPELIVITGDLVEHPREWPPLRRELQALTAPLGIFYVTGNHEWHHGRAWVEGFKAELEELGVTVLANGAVRLDREGAGLWLAGVEDPIQGHADLAGALANVSDDAPLILLAHAPDLALDARVQRAALILAGHTHGGQICLPDGGAIVTNIRGPRAWMSGWHDLGGPQLFVSRGVGTTWLPIRLNCPAELPVIRLRRRKEASG